MQADSAGRALSSLVTKMIKNKGFPYEVYSKLYHSCISSVSLYGSEVFGFHKFDSLHNIHLRAIRAFLGLPKNTTSCGLVSEFDWLVPQAQAQIKMVQHYGRLMKIENNRLIKKVYNWDYNLNETKKVETWSAEVASILYENALGNLFRSQQQFNTRQISDQLKECMLKKQQEAIKTECLSKPKLRTFVGFKDFGKVSPHIGKSLSFVEKKAVSQLRLGILPIRLETARYLRPLVPETERVCYCNSGEIENEVHLLFHCTKYDHLRSRWLEKLDIPENFLTITDAEKLGLVLNVPEHVKPTARYLVAVMDLRRMINKSY